MKKIIIVLFSFLIISLKAQPVYKQDYEPTNQTLNFDTKTFFEDYQNNVDHLLENFKTNSEHPLNAKIFDIADKNVYSFLESSVHWKTHGEMMANIYYPSFFVNNKPTSFCFILYDSKSVLLESYSKILKYNEIVDYLTFHEMGHCFEEYINQTTGEKFSSNTEETELFADIFAIANLLYFQKNIQAEKVIKINESADKKDYHYQPQRLLRALEKLKALKINEIVEKPNVNKIVEISKSIFFSLKQEEIINPNLAMNNTFKENTIKLQTQNSTLSGWTITRTK
jgi:hypothetical protein